ncbi:MAG: AAA family ATPase [Deltaproteobacteria bacterium CG11_big_fil_rev_8_21_14_0_20_49_13]|nr:MAG: AAA family ATPase [Deltaproteobacteria bacterium CG11_big_fil_rev_8_21_14_0_20_49_13]
MFQRIAPLPSNPKESFFLWGPRKTGKTFLIKHLYPNSHRIDLLNTDSFAKYSVRPALLREECLANIESDPTASRLVLIDEVQKIPKLLDEVHLLIEDHHFVFGMCGSSARKLKRGHANLLGGRAVRYELRGLTFPELGNEFDLTRLINHGYLPSHYLSGNHLKLTDSYVNEYLKEEIAAEGLVRNLPLFSDFLRAAAFSDTEIVNYSNIASDCGVSGKTVKEYFQILQDTLIGEFLPAYTRRAKRKVIHSPKFYYFDVALPNLLTRRGELQLGSEMAGKAFENWLFHELKSYITYKEKSDLLSYWKLADSGREVDFVVNDCEVAIEAKGTSRVRPDHLKGLRELKKEHQSIKKLLLVCLEELPRLTDDQILILPYRDFLQSLWQGDVF